MKRILLFKLCQNKLEETAEVRKNYLNETLQLLHDKLISGKYNITHEEANDYMLNSKILEGIFINIG